MYQQLLIIHFTIHTLDTSSLKEQAQDTWIPNGFNDNCTQNNIIIDSDHTYCQKHFKLARNLSSDHNYSIITKIPVVTSKYSECWEWTNSCALCNTLIVNNASKTSNNKPVMCNIIMNNVQTPSIIIMTAHKMKLVFKWKMDNVTHSCFVFWNEDENN